MLKRTTLTFTLLALFAALANAGVIVLSWPEQNGPGDPILPFTLDAGTLAFTVPVGETIIGAVFDSTLGNTTVASTAVMDVFVNGVLVGSCPDTASPCWTGALGVTPFSHTFTAAELASLSGGAADLTITQTDCCVIRLGASTLTITTDGAGVPEPATSALLGLGLVSLALAMRRRKV